MEILGSIVDALGMAFAMFWEILWALILGFFLSAVVQAVVSKSEMQRLLPDDSAKTLTVAAALGAIRTIMMIPSSITRWSSSGPRPNIYRKYYGWKMMWFILGAFYTAMFGGALAIEFLFQAAGWIPQQRNAQIVEAVVTLNYTTILNLIFLIIAGLLLTRFLHRRAGDAT